RNLRERDRPPGSGVVQEVLESLEALAQGPVGRVVREERIVERGHRNLGRSVLRQPLEQTTSALAVAELDREARELVEDRRVVRALLQSVLEVLQGLLQPPLPGERLGGAVQGLGRTAVLLGGVEQEREGLVGHAFRSEEPAQSDRSRRR